MSTERELTSQEVADRWFEEWVANPILFNEMRDWFRDRIVKIRDIDQAVVDHWKWLAEEAIKENAIHQAEIERLRNIVDKLPKTADGVPVVPGMEVFYVTRGNVTRHWIDGNLCVICSKPHPDTRPYSWYSSAEAALKAYNG